MIIDDPKHLDLAHRLADHLATDLTEDGQMPCPRCGGDYGPTMPLSDLEIFTDGYLPGAPMLLGVCLDCAYSFEPKAFLGRWAVCVPDSRD